MSEPFMYITIPGMEQYPHVTYTWVIMILFAVMTFTVRGAMHMVPTGLQNFLEAAVVALADFMDATIGHGGRRFLPLIGTLAFFILAGNLMGLIPGCNSPTSNLNTNVALAVTVFAVYNIVGIQKHGIAYFKQFLGPIWWMTPLMLPIEIISHVARPVTLAVRLFGNIKGEDLVILVLGFLIPLILPVPMMAFAVFTSILQTLVFILLSMVYLAGALSDEH
ncbi:MAG: ATP synthase subunit a [bacterium]|nr:MAG: ATP synthase subunit a [bacterium]